MKKNILKKVLPLTLVGVMMLGIATPAMATNDPWSISDATKTDATYTVDGTAVKATVYEDYYLDDTDYLTDAQYQNAKVCITVPEGADSTTPVLYVVNNGGWLMNTYSPVLVNATSYDTTIDEGKAQQAANALKNGYILVEAGLRSRMQGWQSPVTVSDAKAVIKYLRYNKIGNNELIFITGTSGGGALSSVIGASGNSSDYYKDLYKIGSAGMDNASTSSIRDDIFGVVAYCPITDLGHADGSYEFTYAAARQALLDSGYLNTSAGFSLSDTTMSVSKELASEWTTYVNALDLKAADGSDLVAAFDKTTLTASGTLYDEMEDLITETLQSALTDLGYAEFIAKLQTRTAATQYSGGTPTAGWQTSWLTFNAENTTIEAVDMDGFLYYVALGQNLKNAPAFTNQGTSEEGRNENNLFAAPGDSYGYLSELVWNIQAPTSPLLSKYADWDTYWAANGALLTLQARMTDSIAYLVDTEGTDAGDTAPYWYARHGIVDRDTGFANQTLYYSALNNEETIKTLDFQLEWFRGHEGSYGIAGAQAFMNAAVAEYIAANTIVTPPTTVTPPATVTPSATVTPPATSPKTGDSSLMIPSFVAFAAAAGLGLVVSRKKKEA